MKKKNDDAKKKINPSFDWVGLFALLIGIELPLLALGYLFMLPLPTVVLKFMIILPPLILVIFIKRYTKQNIFVALVLIICTLHPIRVLEYWWLNPIIYGVVTAITLFLTWRTVTSTSWKQSFSILLMICTLLLANQTVESLNEVGKCVIDDNRWTDYYGCQTGNWYQQIQSLPIGMQGWCYYCPWHRGVGFW